MENQRHPQTIYYEFLVYYLMDEENSTIWITAVMNAKRDQIERLKEMPIEGFTT